MKVEALARYIEHLNTPSYNLIRSMKEAEAYYTERRERLAVGEPPHIELGPDPRGEARLRQLRAKCGVKHG